MLKYWVLLDSQAVNPYTCLVGGGSLFSESDERSTDFWQASNLTAVSFFAAPTGRLEWWMKVSEDHTHKQLNIHLFWKVYKWQVFIFLFFVKSAFKMPSDFLQILYFRNQNSSVPTGKTHPMLCPRKNCRARRKSCALPWGTTALSHCLVKQRKCTWVL